MKLKGTFKYMPILVEMDNTEGNRVFKVMDHKECQFGICAVNQEDNKFENKLELSGFKKLREISDKIEQYAIKHDQEKPRYDLLPYDAIEQVVQVLTLGAKKYSDRNWEQGLKYSRCFAALQRHLVAWFQKREELDNETKTHHLANAACELLFLLSYEIRNTDINLDDRPVVNKPIKEN